MMDLELLDKRKSSKQQAELHLPGDIALAGFDDVRDIANTDPPLTTVHMLKLEMGVVAAQRLIDLIRHPLPDGPPIKLVVPTSVVLRATTLGDIRGTRHKGNQRYATAPRRWAFSSSLF